MSYSSVVLADTPTVYLKLNETSGTVATDSSGNGHNGSYVGTPLLGAAPMNGDTTSFSFSTNGGTGRVTSSILPSVTAFSIEIIMCRTTSATALTLFATDVLAAVKGFDLYANAAGVQMNGTFNAAVGSFNNIVVDNQHTPYGKKHHVCMTYDSSLYKVYVDGVLVNQTTVTGNYVPSVTYTVVAIGADPAGGVGFFGYLSDYALYQSTALTAAKVRTHAQQLGN